MKAITMMKRLFAGLLLAAGAAQAATPVTTYFHNDLAGSPVAATNEAGVVIWREGYYPYGERLQKPLTDNKVWFTARREDPETGLVYMGARYYDPVAGRFIQPDPVHFVDSNVHSFNRYAYGNNNPYRFRDPGGKWAEDIALAVPSLTIGSVNLKNNLSAGNGWSAAVDAVGLLVDLVAAATPGIPGGAGLAITAGRAASESVANAVPTTLARVIPEMGLTPSTLGRPGAADVFVTAAHDIRGLTAAQIAEKLTIPPSGSGFRVLEFPTPSSGLASPINRADPGFIGGGRTAGGAREFVLPNGPIPAGASSRVVR